MARYITTDTRTGEIVEESNNHPRGVRPTLRRLSLPEAWELLELKGKAFMVAVAVLALVKL